jgi:hypothetical protein
LSTSDIVEAVEIRRGKRKREELEDDNVEDDNVSAAETENWVINVYVVSHMCFWRQITMNTVVFVIPWCSFTYPQVKPEPADTRCGVTGHKYGVTMCDPWCDP